MRCINRNAVPKQEIRPVVLPDEHEDDDDEDDDADGEALLQPAGDFIITR